MFIRRKTYSNLIQKIREAQEQSTANYQSWRMVGGDLQHTNKVFNELYADYVLLQSKYAHLREVLENIRTFGGLLQRHRRSIAAALREEPKR